MKWKFQTKQVKILLLALAVGYAAFSDTLTISGTANAKGTFDLEFQNPVVDSTVGCNVAGTTATVSTDKNTLDVAVKDLAYPGAGAQFTVDIVNVGSIPAKVTSVTPVGLSGSENIKISGLDQITTDHPVVEAGDKCTLTFTVEWDEESSAELTEAEKEGVAFSLEVEYTQSTDGATFDGAADHIDG